MRAGDRADCSFALVTGSLNSDPRRRRHVLAYVLGELQGFSAPGIPAKASLGATILDKALPTIREEEHDLLCD